MQQQPSGPAGPPTRLAAASAWAWAWMSAVSDDRQHASIGQAAYHDRPGGAPPAAPPHRCCSSASASQQRAHGAAGGRRGSTPPFAHPAYPRRTTAAPQAPPVQGSPVCSGRLLPGGLWTTSKVFGAFALDSRGPCRARQGAWAASRRRPQPHQQGSAATAVAHGAGREGASLAPLQCYSVIVTGHLPPGVHCASAPPRA